MNLAYKIGVIGLGGVTVSTGAYVGIQHFKKGGPSVSSHLTDLGYKLISSIDNSNHLKLQWEAEFRSDKEKIKALIGFVKESDEEGGKALEKWCSSKLKKDYSNRIKNIQEVKDYCVLRTITNQLSRDNKKMLTRNEKDNGKWDQTYAKRKETKTLSPRSQVGLTGEWPSESDPDTKAEDLPKIKSWCESKSESYFFAYEKTYEYVNNWCTEDGANITKAAS